MSITDAIKWIETRLDEGAWFRRIYVFVATVLTWQVVWWSFDFARQALATKAELVGVAAVIGAINAGVSIVQSAAFKQYLEAKKGDA